MAYSSLALPIDVPWKQIATSPDMMDVTFCNKAFPFDWRSSLAISVFEPGEDILPPDPCGDKITYLKVTATITGYQPTKAETDQGFASFPNVPTEDLTRILGEYFACYGVLVNVAIFPSGNREIPLDGYPHIIDFEPKTRDLYQAATETGEVLTASSSDVKTGKTLTHTDTTETGLDVSATYKSPETQYGSVEASSKFSQKWGSTDQDSRSTQADASRERRETQGTSTSISQMYNILTGYHPGTNRAVFLMLPRPHILQPTDHRSFVKGLRIIEGVQEFFLVVSRPSDLPGLCVEVSLETGHFPENVTVNTPPPQYNHSSEDFKVTAHGSSGTPYGQPTVHIDTTYNVTNGWVIERTLGDPAHSGVAETPGGDMSNNQAKSSLRSYNYGAQSDGTAFVSGTIEGANWWGSGAIFDRTYTVFTRSQDPIPATTGPSVGTDAFITSRGLCVCFKSGDCPEVIGGKKHIPGDWIVHEPTVSIDSAALPAPGDVSRLPAMKELLRSLHYNLATSWRMPTRHAPGDIGFLDSDYFKNQIAKYLPPASLNQSLANAPAADPAVVDALGGDVTVGDALDLDLATFAKRTGLEVKHAAAARRKLLESAGAGSRGASAKRGGGSARS